MNSSPLCNSMCQVLILPKAPTPSTRWVPIEEPLVDYNKNITMTSNHYVIKLDQKLQHKEVATIEREHHKQMMIELKELKKK